jgi:16S rRNA (cytidine1402-2'-O)-methyltransferase
VSREISKLHEETLRGPAGAIAATLAARPAIKGEFVIVLSAVAERVNEVTDATLDQSIADALRDNSASKAAGLLSRRLGMPRDLIYARILALKDQA